MRDRRNQHPSRVRCRGAEGRSRIEADAVRSLFKRGEVAFCPLIGRMNRRGRVQCK